MRAMVYLRSLAQGIAGNRATVQRALPVECMLACLHGLITVHDGITNIAMPQGMEIRFFKLCIRFPSMFIGCSKQSSRQGMLSRSQPHNGYRDHGYRWWLHFPVHPLGTLGIARMLN
jgi:hypothetical protein